MSTTKVPEPFEMKDAVRQQFTDSIIAALNARAEPGYGYGWHLVELNVDETGTGVMVFRTARPLIQWQKDKEWHGPHEVKVTVNASIVAVATES